MKDLIVPFGVNNSEYLVPGIAIQIGEKYTCPRCEVQLIPDMSKLKNKKLKHPANTPCIYTDENYITAKQILKGAIIENIGALETLNVTQSCHSCKVPVERALKYRAFDGVQVDYLYDGALCDLLCSYTYNNKVEYLGIELIDDEINQTPNHNLSHSQMLTTWMTLNINDILQDPYWLKPVFYKLSPRLCEDCKAKSKKHSLAANVAARYGIPDNLFTTEELNTGANYIANTEVCYKCSHEIPVFWWKGTPFCKQEPPLPRPYTIQLRFSKQYGGKYWANTCPNCNALQGDNHLHIFDGGQFKYLNNNPRKKAASNAVELLKKRTHLFK
jgi:hypothetical protein